RRAFHNELLWGPKGAVEVVIGEGPWCEMATPRSSSSSRVLPLLVSTPLRSGQEGTVEVIRSLDPSHDRYLLDHQLDGKPVFPFAMAMELMAEVVQAGWPEWEVVGIRSSRLLRGIVLADAIRKIRVIARPHPESLAGELLEVDVEIGEIEKPEHPNYRAMVQLGKRLPSSPSGELESLSSLRPFPLTVDDAYRQWLFHGPCFQGISTIEGISEEGICAIVQPSSPAQGLFQNGQGHWVIDPVLLDCGFQLAILWERAYHDMTPLPNRFKLYHRFGSPSGSPVRCSLRAWSREGGHNLLTDVYFQETTTGRVIGILEGMEFSCSQALNRLAQVRYAIARPGGRSLFTVQGDGE
ncbi:MAG: hypothetical protein D6736_14865, partial [Nitrospinota bacterium]